MIGMMIYHLLRKARLPLIGCITVSIVLMIQYGDMTGMSSSAYRAIFMFAMKISAKCIRRTYDMLTAMMLACILIVCENPLYLYHSGFQLSFGAIIGIGLLLPVFCTGRRMGKGELRKQYSSEIMVEIFSLWQRIKQSIQGSMAINAIHFPILLSQYYTFPIYSILLNLLVIPLMSVLLGAGILLLGIGIIAEKIAFIPAEIIHFILYLYEWLAKISVESFRGNWIVGCPKPVQIVAYFVLLLILVYSHKRLPVFLRYLYLLAGIVLLTACNPAQNRITILDVGQGDGICIETQNGHCYLIDGGSSSKKEVAVYQMLPFLKYRGINEIEAVFLTHLDEDHISGVKQIIEKQHKEGIRIKNVILSCAVVQDDAYGELLALCRQYHVAVKSMRAGDALCDGNWKIRCLFPDVSYTTEDRNAASLVLEVSCGSFQGLFTGDVTQEGEQQVAEQLQEEQAGAYQLLKASHHGSRYSNTLQLLQQIQPKLVVVSSGSNNRYGHPHQEALERFEQVGAKVLRTDESGAITVVIGKQKIYVK